MSNINATGAVHHTPEAAFVSTSHTFAQGLLSRSSVTSKIHDLITDRNLLINLTLLYAPPALKKAYVFMKDYEHTPLFAGLATGLPIVALVGYQTSKLAINAWRKRHPIQDEEPVVISRPLTPAVEEKPAAPVSESPATAPAVDPAAVETESEEDVAPSVTPAEGRSSPTIAPQVATEEPASPTAVQPSSPTTPPTESAPVEKKEEPKTPVPPTVPQAPIEKKEETKPLVPPTVPKAPEKKPADSKPVK